MSRFIAFFISLLMIGAAHAAEIADAPIPEDNYTGIIIFLVLMVGGTVWFFWKIMRNSSKDKQQSK
jgi:hypothetical protein